MESKEDLRKRLSDEAYRVTQEGGTEAPFTGAYYKNKADGMYHCVVCNAPLFSSVTKFDSYSGWPSFYDVANDDSVSLRSDDSLGMERTEVLCAKCGGHLGHVFRDAPDTPTGQRYCINSCALSFEEREGGERGEGGKRAGGERGEGISESDAGEEHIKGAGGGGEGDTK